MHEKDPDTSSLLEDGRLLSSPSRNLILDSRTVHVLSVKAIGHASS